MASLKRYIRLYFVSIKRSIMSRWVYKADTFIALIAFLFTNTIAILSIYFIINSVTELPKWNMYQIGFLYGFTMLPIALDHLFSDELWRVAYWRVKDGSLDMYFYRPVPVLFEVICETFQPEGFGELIVGIIMLSVCGANLAIQWSFGMVFMLIIATIFGALIITSLKIIFTALAFPMKRSGPLLQIVYNFSNYVKYPISIFPNVIKAMLTFLFPYALFVSYPVNTLFGYGSFFNDTLMNPYILSLIIVGVAILFLSLSILIWNLCIKKYESTGS